MNGVGVRPMRPCGKLQAMIRTSNSEASDAHGVVFTY